jgi:methylated-DNA-[protein]-cysteine S-methyltransferase
MGEKHIETGAPAWHDRMATPIGVLLLCSDARGAITGVWFPGESHAPVGDLGRRDAGPFVELRSQLAEYFAGARQTFAVPTATVGTRFQRTVWAELGLIGFGRVTTYRDLAVRLGRPRAARAVGQAGARNPLGILVPCHRVLGAAGSLTGYGGGIGAKRWLIEHERQVGSGPVTRAPAGSGQAL